MTSKDTASVSIKSTSGTTDADLRDFKREQFQDEDRFFLDVGGIEIGKILDLNFTGALVEVNPDLGGSFEKGQRISGLSIRSNQVTLGDYPGATICHVGKSAAGMRLGLLFHLDEVGKERQVSERKNNRLKLNPKFLPQGTFDNPLKLNETITIQILDISRTGARFVTSARNRMLIRGLVIESAKLFFPSVGILSCSFKIQWTRKVKGSDTVEGGVAFSNADKNFEQVLSKYLLSFADSSSESIVKEIADANLRTNKVKTAVTFHVCNTAKDYEGVLNLRRAAYARAGKVAADVDPSSMADRYDNHSRIVIAKYRDRVVGSVRFTFCTGKDQSFELDESIVLPKKFDRLKTIEASRACVDAHFENSDLIHGLFELGAQICLKTQSDWVITSCDEKLLSLYGKLGFKKQGVTFELATLGGIPHILIAAPIKVIYTSSGLNPAIWHFSYRPVANYLKRMGYISEIDLSLPKKAIYAVVKFLLRKN